MFGSVYFGQTYFGGEAFGAFPDPLIVGYGGGGGTYPVHQPRPTSTRVRRFQRLAFQHGNPFLPDSMLRTRLTIIPSGQDDEEPPPTPPSPQLFPDLPTVPIINPANLLPRGPDGKFLPRVLPEDDTRATP